MTAEPTISPNNPIVLAAGGTGGHLFPAEALARELMQRGRSVALVTDRRGHEFPVAGVPTHRVPTGRMGGGPVGKAFGLLRLGIGMLTAEQLLRRLLPEAVVGFGGYPSAPTMLAATRMGLPTVIHEQNAVLGRTNKMLATRVRRIATCFETVQGLSEAERNRVVRTGNPVRAEFVAVRGRGYDPPRADGPIRILVLGGSQGARILSQVVPAAFKELPRALQQRLSVAQQVRAEDLAAVEAAYAGSGIKVELQRFFGDVPERLATTHLQIGRAGGSTMAELTVAGRPSVLVPFAAAIADEQTANARVLVEHGGAWLLPEAEFTPAILSGMLERVLTHPAALARAAAAAYRLGEPEATRHLADLVETVAQERWR
jgi:UDP-N-acetylglucosamine--N-acetylmuramyl-(pentapeptide) pyrophosphoryl-undecaprenol N-acetylglucosamine transferase